MVYNRKSTKSFHFTLQRAKEKRHPLDAGQPHTTYAGVCRWGNCGGEEGREVEHRDSWYGTLG